MGMLDAVRANGPEGDVLDWDAVDWRQVEDDVRRLRQRIFTASRAGDLKKVRSLHCLARGRPEGSCTVASSTPVSISGSLGRPASAAGRRAWRSLLGSSCARWGVEPSSRSAYRRASPPDPNGVVVLHRSKSGRAGRPLNPGDGGALPAGDYPPAGTCRFPAASPYGPAETSHLRGSPSRGVIRGSLTFAHHPQAAGCRLRAGKHRCFPAGLLLACGPRMEREPLRL